MSQENLARVQRSYEAFAEGRLDTEFLHPKLEWRGPREFPDLAEPHYGVQGVQAYMATIAEAFDDYRMVAEEFIDLGGDRVLVFAREGGSGKGSGLEVQTNPTGHLWTFRDGKAIRMQSYWERPDALEAAGLRDS